MVQLPIVGCLVLVNAHTPDISQMSFDAMLMVIALRSVLHTTSHATKVYDVSHMANA